MQLECHESAIASAAALVCRTAHENEHGLQLGSAARLVSLGIFREALRSVLEEGLEARWERQRRNQQAVNAGLEALGLELFVPNPADRLITVSAVKVPKGVEDEKVRHQLLDEFGIEIAGGFGPIKGQIWRVGLMGWSSQKNHVLLFLAALEKTLLDQGFRVPSGAGVGAAVRSYTQSESAAARHERVGVGR